MKKMAGILILTILLLNGCVWDDDCGYGCSFEEEIVFINTTGWNIECFIDNQSVGIVAPNNEMHIFGEHYEGVHLYYAECKENDCNTHWGPTEFFMNEGELFRIYLDIGSSR